MTEPNDDSRAACDSILRSALEPDPSAASRIVASALATRSRRAPSFHLLGVAAALLVFAIWTAHKLRGAPATTLTSGPGGIVVVRTARGDIALYQNAQPARLKQMIIRQGGSS